MLKPRGSSMNAAATRAWGVVMLCVLIIGLTYMSEEAKLAQTRDEVMVAKNERAQVQSTYVEKFKKMQRDVEELKGKIKESQEGCKASIAAEQQRITDEYEKKFLRQESARAELDRLMASEQALEGELKDLKAKHNTLLQQKADLETEITRVRSSQGELTAALQMCTAKVKAQEAKALEAKRLEAKLHEANHTNTPQPMKAAKEVGVDNVKVIKTNDSQIGEGKSAKALREDTVQGTDEKEKKKEPRNTDKENDSHEGTTHKGTDEKGDKEEKEEKEDSARKGTVGGKDATERKGKDSDNKGAEADDKQDKEKGKEEDSEFGEGV